MTETIGFISGNNIYRRNLLQIVNPLQIHIARDFWRVPGGTRTHDIQNHNLTL